MSRTSFYILFVLIFSAAILPAQRISTIPVYLNQQNVLNNGNIRYPQSLSFNDTIYLFYQEIESIAGRYTQNIVYQRSYDGLTWSQEEQIVSQIPLEVNPQFAPPIYSAAASEGELSIAVLIRGDIVEIYTITTQDALGFEGKPGFSSENWRREVLNTSGAEFIPPSIFPTSEGMMLFGLRRYISPGQDSENRRRGIAFSFRPFPSSRNSFAETQLLPVLEDQNEVLSPYLLEKGGQFYLAYESVTFRIDTGFTHQVYLMRSQNMGETWTEPQLISNFIDIEDQTEAELTFDSYSNQNPRLYEGISNQLLLLIDRNRNGQSSRVSIIRLDPEGRVLTYRNRKNIYISPSNRSSTASNLFIRNGITYVLYSFDALGSSQVHVASEGIIQWNSAEISQTGGVNYSPQLVQHRSKVHFFWLQKASNESELSRLINRSEDQFLDTPIIQASNHILGQASNNEQAEFSILIPADVAGVQSLYYAWTESDNPPESEYTQEYLGGELTQGARRLISFSPRSPGEWYFSLFLEDGSGNRSEKQVVRYLYDDSPPAPIRLNPFPIDAQGFLLSNTIDLTWEVGENSDVIGYRYFLEYLGSDPSLLTNDEGRILLASLSDSLEDTGIGNRADIQTPARVSLNNAENGVWALAVSALDQAGNESEVEIALFALNKYIPSTELDLVRIERSQEGQSILEFNGRGYLANGIIERIIFDRDAESPWDYELLASEGDYIIQTDKVISNIRIPIDLDGDYQLILEHSNRGLYLHNEGLSFELSGAVKLGDYFLYSPPLASQLSQVLLVIPAQSILIIVLLVLFIAIFIFSTSRIRSIISDSKDLEAEVLAIIEGRVSPSALSLQERLTIVKKQGIGLQVKFTTLVLALVIAVVMVIALPMSNFILTNQQITLVQGLEDRVRVMITSLGAGVENILSDSRSTLVDKLRGLGDLSTQTRAMSEIEYFTVTAGPNPNEPNLDSEEREYIWFTNDPLLLKDELALEEYNEDIDPNFVGAAYFQRQTSQGDAELFRPGVFILEDKISNLLRNELIPNFNETDPAIQQLVANLNSIIAQRSTGGTVDLAESIEQENILRDRLAKELDAKRSIGTNPILSIENYDVNSQYYLVYFPLYWIDNNFAAEYQGTIRLGISTASINQVIRNTQRDIRIQVLIFTVIALAAGLAGALVLASITINPIRKLVSGVERIRDTEIISELKNKPIIVKTRDELNVLSNTINQMTDGLIKAEEANKSLMLGKDLQKMFISLDPNPNDLKTKSTTRHEKTDHVEFFGYYEGAKGVSGDYFYYQKITDRQYALIKCDVSGKDIEAALIMVTVATLILEHFNNWQEMQIRRKHLMQVDSKQKSETILTELTKNINSIIFEREFKGKFAAFSLLTLDEQTGIVNFCNAGDNLVHIYRKNERKVVVEEFSQTPAAGAISEEVMGISLNFPEEQFRLNSGDILLLFTDGFEEARRYIRHNNWEIYQESEFSGEIGKKKRVTLEEEMKPYIMTQDEGGMAESFSAIRIHTIIEAVMNRNIYKLIKFRNPAGDEELEFDFTTLEPSLSNVVLSLLAIEKIFRLVPLPNLDSQHRISIDKKIDDFLKQHFVQYSTYFHHPVETPKESLYQVYNFISEDSQYDDLTILAVEKK